MTTGDKYSNIVSTRLMGSESFKDYFLDYLRNKQSDLLGRCYDKDGTFGTSKVAISASGNDEFDLAASLNGTDGSGHELQTDDTYCQDVQFENTNTIDYDIGLKYAIKPDGLQINPRDGMPIYERWEESIGESGDPTSVTDNGTNITFNINSLIDNNRTHENRKCLVWLDTPAAGATTEDVAVEECTVVYSGGNNTITTTGLLGQSTVSTTASDYTVLLLGPTVTRSSELDLEAASEYWYIGHVTGTGAGNPPTIPSDSVDDQRLVAYSVSDLIEDWFTLFVNVKDEAYGAEGNGITDDTTAIEAAITAAAVAGGTVFFPAGRYRITDTIDIPKNVSLLGAGSEITVLAIDNASNADLLNYPTVGTPYPVGWQNIEGLAFESDQANTGSFVYIGNYRLTNINSCFFNGIDMTGDLIDDSTDSGLMTRISNCNFEIDGSGVSAIKTDSSYRTIVEGCYFNCETGYDSSMVYISKGIIRDCEFKTTGSAGSSANYVYIDIDGNFDRTRVNNCYFATSSNCCAFELSDIPQHEQRMFVENNNQIYCTAYRNSVAGGAAVDLADNNIIFGSRIGREVHQVEDPSGGATVTIDALNYEVTLLQIAAGNTNNFTIAVNSMPAPYSRLVVVVYPSAGSNDITWDTTDFASESGGESFTTVSLDIHVFEFMAVPKVNSTTEGHLVFAKMAANAGAQD
jgi:hypothetical protein